MSTKIKSMRSILKGLLDDAKAEAGDVLTDPTWNLDYLFGFKLTVKQLREIDAFLSRPIRRHPKPRKNGK